MIIGQNFYQLLTFSAKCEIIEFVETLSAKAVKVRFLGMKKTVIAALSAALMIALSGCGKANEDAATFTAKPTEKTEAPVADVVEESQLDPAEMTKLYKTPSQFETIDTSLEDPSTATMKFIFEEDEKARISGIYYTIDDHLVMVNYAYTDDNKVKIVAFAESTLVADLEFALPEYDPNAGFTEHEGYYFKGYKFD